MAWAILPVVRPGGRLLSGTVLFINLFIGALAFIALAPLWPLFL